MSERESRRIAGAAPRVDGDARRAWIKVYEYQKARLERTYSDFEESGEDLHKFFFEFVYLHPDRRVRYEKRDMSFVRISRNWLFRKLTTRELHAYLEKTILLQHMTDAFDVRVARNLVAQGVPSGNEPVPDAAYRRAYLAETSRPERIAQIESVLKTFELCNRIVNELPLNLEQILRYTPKVFMRNTDLLDLCIQAYHTFTRHGARLNEYDAVLREREMDYIDSMFGKEDGA
jgi:hypothetical protein